MQTTERPPTGSPRGTSPARGVILVAVAVVLGFFVLRAIDDTGGDPPTVEAEKPAGEAGGEGSGATPETPDTTAPPATHAPGEVTVLVANASGVTGAAAAQTETVAGAGYATAEPTDSPQASETTQVLAVAGFEADATALATAIGAAPEAVQAMPEPPPVELGGAQVLILLGTDLAG
jgi:LytR cell envelope-related transcriptional attenuator